MEMLKTQFIKMTKDTKIAFITGGNRGLGLQTARELGQLGILVVIGSRDGERGKAAAAMRVSRWRATSLLPLRP